MAALRIGYLHVGAAAHGVRRYGALLAAEARRRGDVEIIEAELRIVGEPSRDDDALAEAGRRLSAADVVHLQYNPKIWGGLQNQLRHLQAFARHCDAPLVATFHDVYPQFGAAVLRRLRSLRRRVSDLGGRISQPVDGLPDRRIARAAARAVRPIMAPTSSAALRWLLDHVHAAFVSSREEARRLSQHGRARVAVVPHFVEERGLDIDPAEARAALGLEKQTIVTVLGFIHARKGHHLVVEALPKLGPHVQAIFAGGATTDGPTYLQDILALAEARGVRDRVHVTGYVPEEVLDRYLTATDLAVCPFLACSASGSLSTWISAGRPIIASDLPQIAEYNALEPGAIDIFRPTRAAALADALRERLAGGMRPENAAVSRLARKLRISTIFEEHLTWYRTAATTHARPVAITDRAVLTR